KYGTIGVWAEATPARPTATIATTAARTIDRGKAGSGLRGCIGGTSERVTNPLAILQMTATACKQRARHFGARPRPSRRRLTADCGFLSSAVWLGRPF